MTVTVYGASDDLIEVEGSLREEFDVTGEGENGDGHLLAFSNGVLLRVVYTDDGVWRVTPLVGADRVTITFAVSADDDNYSDRAVMDDDPAWVVLGTDYGPKPSRSKR